MKNSHLTLVCTLLSSLLLLPAAGRAQSPPGSEESAFLSLINAYRASNGVGPLAISQALSNSSNWMSNDMAAKNYFSHTDSLGRDPGTRIAAFGYPFFPWGENVAAGYAGAQNTLNQFINACDADASGNCTYGHRNNMLNGGFSVIGIARVAGGIFGWYWTTDFGGVVDQPQTSAPAINTFSVLPSTIVAGLSATLTWNVSGADTITIDNGVGIVTGFTSRTVSPGATTTWKLTATNAFGSSVASATVTVTAPVRDNQPPTAPVITSAAAAAATEVDLAWTGSTDNVGVTGYQILRNGSTVGSVGASIRSWADLTVLANSTYSYAVKAFDASGNYSVLSNAVLVTTPAPPVTTGCPPPATNAFTGCYFNNINLNGTPVLIRTDSQINFDWPGSTPGLSVPAAFSVRWQGSFDFDQANYAFTAIASDGMRVYVDGNPFATLDRWWDHPPSRYTFELPMSLGRHLITVEYYERTGSAAAHISWQSLGGPSGTAPVISSLTSTPSAITAGQSATLSWNVSGASASAIDNGVGDVTGSTSRIVSPGVTTTYKLTAANGAGSSPATVTVTVTAPAGDTQPPTAPVITSAVAASAQEVDLTWTASTDNIGVAGYQIIRNGSPAGTVSASILAWADNSVLGNSTYSYAIKAYDAAGNYSLPSAAAPVTTPAPPAPPSACLGPATNAFTGCYFNNINLTGSPVLVRTDNQINFDWAGGTPGPAVPAAFSARWQGNFDFDQATWTFSVIASDGMRVYIDGNPFPVLDKWSDHPPYRFTFQSSPGTGRHLITVEYYEQTGSSAAHLSWQKNP